MPWNQQPRFFPCLGNLTLAALILAHSSHVNASPATGADTTESVADASSRQHTQGDLTTILQELEDGTPLKMRNLADQTYIGDLLRRDSKMVLISVDRFDEAPLDPETVETLWIQNGDRADTGLLVGAALGFVGLSLLGGYLVGSLEHPSASAALATGLFVGIPVGAALGSLFGRSMPKWRAIYPVE